MASIKKTNEKGTSITILTVSGVLSFEEVIHSLENFFKRDVTKNLLWDFRDADLSKITPNNMEQIIKISKSNAHLRENGRTALVVYQDLSFGLSRMYEILSELSEHSIPHCVFRDMGEAIKWLEYNQ